MGIRFLCPNGHKLNVKTFLAGKRAICPDCGARVLVPFPGETLPTEADLPGTGAETTTAFDSRTTFDGTDLATSSVVIAVEPNAVAPTIEGADPGLGLQSTTIGLIPESIVARPIASPAPDEAPAIPQEATHGIDRQRLQRRQFGIAITLFLVVVVLAVVLVWVLQRDTSNVPEATTPQDQTSTQGT